MLKTNILNEIILKQEGQIDSVFYVEGIRNWDGVGCFGEYIKQYLLGRWWIFVHQN